MKVQPIDFNVRLELPPPLATTKYDATAKPISKSRFKRLFERPFSNVLKTSATEKPVGSTEPQPSHDCNKDAVVEEFEPSSMCLAKMVQNFMEGCNEKQQKCGRNRCNCFNGEGSDDEPDLHTTSLSHASDALKSLVPCLQASERSLLADTTAIIERNKIGSRKGESLQILVRGLTSLGYNASICKSKWENASSIPAGEYEYVDVVIAPDDRLIIDIDFRSEFEIARSTKVYKHILQILPTVFVGKPDRMEKIITIVSEAARQSLKKKGMAFPPWRKTEYVKAKWLSPFTRDSDAAESSSCKEEAKSINEKINSSNSYVFNIVSNSSDEGVTIKIGAKGLEKGKIVTGLAAVIDSKP